MRLNQGDSRSGALGAGWSKDRFDLVQEVILSLTTWSRGKLREIRQSSENLTSDDKALILENRAFQSIEKTSLLSAIELIEERVRLENQIFLGISSSDEIARLSVIDRTVRGLIDGEGLGDKLTQAVLKILEPKSQLFRLLARQLGDTSSSRSTNWCNASELFSLHQAIAIAATIGCEGTRTSGRETEHWLSKARELAIVEDESDLPASSPASIRACYAVAGAAKTYFELMTHLSQTQDRREQENHPIAMHVARAVLGHYQFKMGGGTPLMHSLLRDSKTFPICILESELRQYPLGTVLEALNLLGKTFPERIISTTSKELDAGNDFEVALQLGIDSARGWIQGLHGDLPAAVPGSSIEATLQNSPEYECFVAGLGCIEKLCERFARTTSGWIYVDNEKESPISSMGQLATALATTIDSSDTLVLSSQIQ